MDGSTIHGKEKEAVYVQFVQKDKFLKGGDPTNTKLLHLAEVKGVSAKVDELKACLDRPFDLLNSFSEDMNKLMEKFISMCTDEHQPISDSLLTRLLVEYLIGGKKVGEK